MVVASVVRAWVKTERRRCAACKAQLIFHPSAFAYHLFSSIPTEMAIKATSTTPCQKNNRTVGRIGFGTVGACQHVYDDDDNDDNDDDGDGPSGWLAGVLSTSSAEALCSHYCRYYQMKMMMMMMMCLDVSAPGK